MNNRNVRHEASASVGYFSFDQLLDYAAGLPNEDYMASMLSSNWAGEGALGPCLGLEPAEYTAMLQRHFPGCPLPATPDDGAGLNTERLPERADLLHLLLRNRAGRDLSEAWLAAIVVAGCMGGDHLWQDLGLQSRRQMSTLLQENYPELARRNSKDMKWKKFLYKQLCMEEGIYICRAPSCEVCSDYAVCFGPES